MEIKLFQILILPADVDSLFLSLIHLFSILRSQESKQRYLHLRLLGWAGVILDFAVLNCNQLPPSSALKLTKLPLIKFLPHSIVDYIEKFKEASLLIQDFQFDKKKLHI